MGKISGDPKGAALTTPKDCEEFPAIGSMTGWVGKKGAKCFLLNFGIEQFIFKRRIKTLKWTLHSDRSHSRSTTTVGNAERLVKVQVRNIWTKITRPAKSNLGVHIGSVHVNLPTSLMDHITNFGNFLFKYTVSRRVCKHQARQSIFVLFSLIEDIEKQCYLTAW